MKNYYLWVVIIGSVILLTAFLVKNGEDKVTSVPNSASTTTDTVKNTTTNTSVKVVTKATPKPETFTNIFPQRGSYECNYEEVTPTRRSTNVIYFSDGKMRGEFREVGGVSNIMVYDGRTLYTWTEGQTVGRQTVPKSISDFPAIVPSNITQGKVLGSGLNNVSWDCHAWSKDNSLLSKPTYVKF